MIIDRYLIREISKPLLAISAILIIISTGASAALYLADATVGMLLISDVSQLILLRTVIYLDLMLPLALYMAVVGGLGRLYTDAEITALQAAGLSELRIVRPVLVVSLLCALLVGWLSLVVRPWAFQQSYQLQAEATARFDFDKVEAGRFYALPGGEQTIFAEKINRRQHELEGVFLTIKHDNKTQVIYAAQAHQRLDGPDDKPVQEFEQGHFYILDSNGTQDVMTVFKQFTLRLDDASQSKEYKRKAASSLALAASNDSADIAELQWRLTRPLATVLLALFGVPLSRAAPRQGKYAKALIAIVIYFIYYYLSAMANKWVDRGKVGSIPGMWWVDTVLACLLLLLLLKQTWIWIFRPKPK